MRTGCRPDPVDERDWSFLDHAGAAPTVLTGDEPSVEKHCPAVWDQIAQDCSAHAFSAVLMVNASVRRAPIPEPSRLFLYAGAQLEERPRQPLVDDGSGLRWMCKFTQGRGVTTEDRWPEVPESINVVPPDDCFTAAEEGTVLAYRRLPDGAASGDALELAIRQEHAPTVCLVVDERFRDTIKGVYDGAGGRSLGPHAMIAVAYSRTLDAFKLRNSWGTRYHDGGYVWVSKRFINLYSFGKWVIERGPERIA